ncbi:MAG: sugar phosphate isomerase/epimerase [Bryobacterales bacterium]|nr:sugar phosphate isomerase/epimerase [Bryobacterales bacterium]
MTNQLARRTFLASSALSRAAIASAQPAARRPVSLPVPGRLPLLLFSKHLHWADFGTCASVLREIGAEGIDLTVRKNGHIEPERVREDLPRAVEIFHKAGTPVVMITTDIRTADSPFTVPILETAKSLGITHYRWSDFVYDTKKPIPEQLQEFKPQIAKLAKLNAKLGMTAMYHIHSGFNRLGSCVWDLWELLRDEDPNAVSFNYDIGHATVEGGFGGWINTLRLALPYSRGTAVKDFVWAKNSQGQWRPRWRPLGEGMVDFTGYFNLLKNSTVPMPLQLHLEYDELGAAAHGSKQLDMPRERVVAMLKRDMARLREMRAKAGLDT